MKKPKKLVIGFLVSAWILAVMYGVGVPLLLLFLLLYCGGRIQIDNYKGLPPLEPGMLVIYNHPDLFDCMFEIFLVPLLWAKQWLRHPFTATPWFTMCRRNFKKMWLGILMKPRAIFINRETANGSGVGARAMRNVLVDRGAIIHPLEPGRTCTGKDFMISPGGKKIRLPTSSVAWLCHMIGAGNLKILLVWTEAGKIVLKSRKPLFSWPHFGREPVIVKYSWFEPPVGWEAMTRAKLTIVIANAMLALADRTT